MAQPRVALIQFPGSNCEAETKRAAEAAGMVCDMFRWNRDPGLLADYDGYIIGGGFSYQDRVRAGVVATKEPVVERVFSEVVDRGKPVLGICNGAQVLVEAGLVPGIHAGEVEMALAPNRPYPCGRISAFSCRWVFVKHVAPAGRCWMTRNIAEGAVIPIPIAHGEGRFTTTVEGLVEGLRERGQIVFQYCTADGEVVDSAEVNPNGAAANIAGLSNPEGNVLAMMPHPERASFLRQIPSEVRHEAARRKLEAWGDVAAGMSAGPGLAVFTSMRDSLMARLAGVAQA